jgi:nitroimidazol reductase NimA-like FMN-containing flavoprotein (pyridoxamine 5'-phosphate oxidase superfamily)
VQFPNEVEFLRVTERTRIRTHPERAAPDDAETIFQQGLIAHIGFVIDGQPYVIPMGYHYEDGKVYIHSRRGGRLPQELRGGGPVCVEVTLLDGLVASRHALYHSMNYRSAIAFGRARAVEGDEAKTAILERMTSRYFEGRQMGVDYHPPSAADLKITDLLEIEIEELNGKKRSGPPKGPLDAEPEGFGTCGVLPVPER